MLLYFCQSSAVHTVHLRSVVPFKTWVIGPTVPNEDSDGKNDIADAFMTVQDPAFAADQITSGAEWLVRRSVWVGQSVPAPLAKVDVMRGNGTVFCTNADQADTDHDGAMWNGTLIVDNTDGQAGATLRVAVWAVQ